MKIKNAKHYVSKIIEKKYSLARIVNDIETQFTNEAHDIFIKELLSEIRLYYCNVTIKLTDDDILTLINTQLEKGCELPTVQVDEETYPKVYHFTKEIGGYRTIQNTFGLKREVPNFVAEFVNLQEFILPLINDPFRESISITNEVPDFTILFEVEDYINESTLKTPIQKHSKIKPTPTIEDDKLNTLEILKVLKCKYNRNLILNSENYNRLTEYILYLVAHHALPEELEPFPITGASNEFIKKTFHLVYLSNGKKHKPLYLELLKLFRQFKDIEISTLNSKFSSYAGDYEKDKVNLITS